MFSTSKDPHLKNPRSQAHGVMETILDPPASILAAVFDIRAACADVVIVRHIDIEDQLALDGLELPRLVRFVLDRLRGHAARPKSH
jgi:hypothetical protein